MNVPGNVPSAHVDQFITTLMPPRAAWPEFNYSAEHLRHYPDRLNATTTLIDDAIAEGFGTKPAFHYGEDSWTYTHLAATVNRMARYLVEDLGLVPGNRVLLRGKNNPMLAALWLAVVKAGGICVTTMPLLRAKELAFILERVKVRFAFCELELMDEMAQAGALYPDLEKIERFTPLGQDECEAGLLDSKLPTKSTEFSAVDTAADDIALIAFTSGTTGTPKAAAHFHRDVLAVCECWTQSYTVEQDEIICGSPPLAFTYGLAALLLYPLRFRATAVLIPAPTPEAMLAAIARWRVSSLYTVPTALRAMLGKLDDYDVSSLCKASSAGEHLQPILWEQWLEKTGLRIVNGIGATEMLTHFISESMGVVKPGSTGLPVPGYEACIVDEDGIPLPPGKAGLIAVRGPTGCRYLDDTDRQAKFVRNGWNVTGDVFEQDADGYLWYIDRADDIIVSSGYNISPQEVERAVLGHNLVAECAVIGAPDPERGKIVKACVVLKNADDESEQTAKAIQDFVKQTVAPYKYPRSVEFFRELPRTPTGKVQRFRLAQAQTGEHPNS